MVDRTKNIIKRKKVCVTLNLLVNPKEIKLKIYVIYRIESVKQ